MKVKINGINTYFLTDKCKTDAFLPPQGLAQSVHMLLLLCHFPEGMKKQTSE